MLDGLNLERSESNANCADSGPTSNGFSNTCPRYTTHFFVDVAENICRFTNRRSTEGSTQSLPTWVKKIRIENGQPIIIDRKERASLTPIGSLAAWGGSSGGMVVKAIDDGTSQLISRKRKGGVGNGTSGSGAGGATAAKISAANANAKDTLMPKETCPVCGIQITYKNLARHIKLRHKIKYKFCHKCRKFVPNDTYEDHRLTCTAEFEGVPSDRNGEINQRYLEKASNESHDSVDASDYLDMDGQSALVINTDDNEDNTDNGDNLDGDEAKNRSNTSKNKLESLLGKEFKHPRRKCGICGYMVSYSNYKRHLKNAHPSLSHDIDETLEGDAGISGGVSPPGGAGIAGNGNDALHPIKYLGHQMDEDEEDLDVSDEQDKNKENSSNSVDTADSIVECHICGDHIMKEFLERHLKMNHDDGVGIKSAVAHKQGSGNEEELTSDGETNNDDEILEIEEDEGAPELHEGASPNSEGAPAKEGAPGALPTKSSEGALVIKRSKGAQRRASLRQSAINEQRV